MSLQNIILVSKWCKFVYVALRNNYPLLYPQLILDNVSMHYLTLVFIKCKIVCKNSLCSKLGLLKNCLKMTVSHNHLCH